LKVNPLTADGMTASVGTIESARIGIPRRVCTDRPEVESAIPAFEDASSPRTIAIPQYKPLEIDRISPP
jgi:hypothetical protein